jgi:16S rRNA (guanine527-N7)-methyltransferase
MAESADELKKLLGESEIALNSKMAKQLRTYLALLEKWNSRINLTSATDWNVVGPLFQEGIWASKIYPEDTSHHLDIGSGAGFPAMVIRILRLNMQLDLVESRGKKGIFLETLANALQLGSIHVHAMRLQAFLQQSDRNKVWNCISWKGLKLGSDDLKLLLEHANADTQFWMFHGSELAAEEPEIFDQYFRLARTERFPGRKLWALSIYLPK